MKWFRLPLLYLAGLGAATSRAAEVLVDGYAAGSLSMTAYTLDAAVGADMFGRRRG
jgi:4,5-DOPA dioxygenase extradiol